MLTSNSQTIHRIAKYQTINALTAIVSTKSRLQASERERLICWSFSCLLLGHTEHFHHYQRSLLFNKTVILEFVTTGKTTDSDALSWNHSEGTARSFLFTSVIDLWGVWKRQFTLLRFMCIRWESFFSSQVDCTFLFTNAEVFRFTGMSSKRSASQ